jgi:hypothetical protein
MPRRMEVMMEQHVSCPNECIMMFNRHNHMIFGIYTALAGLRDSEIHDNLRFLLLLLWSKL